MGSARRRLAAYLRASSEEILAAWQAEVARLTELPRDALRDEIGRVIAHLADDLDAERTLPATVTSAIRHHAAQRLEIGMTLRAVVAELLLLPEVVARSWPGAHAPGGAEALRALRAATDRVLLGTIDRFTDLRTRLFAAVDALVRDYPVKSLDETLRHLLNALLQAVDGVGTAAILLREGDLLRVRAAVGLEVGAQLRVGEGFAGRVAAERAPRLARLDADALAEAEALRRAGVRAVYGVPLLHGDELLGVAHMGSTSAAELPDEVKTVFRALMDRVAGLIAHEALGRRLEVERARYRAVVENAPIVIFSKDTEGRYVTMNRHALAALGLTPEQFVGRTDAEVFPPGTVEAVRDSDRRVLASGETEEREEEIPGPAGRRFYLTIKFPIVDAEGRTIGIGGISTDITERRRWTAGRELLAEIGGVLASSSLDFGATLAEVAGCVVPALADCCIVDLLEDDGAIRRALVRHRDPARQDLARRLAAVEPATDRPYLVEAALTTRDLVHVAEVTRDHLDTLTRDEAQRALLSELDPTSMIQVPLEARGRLLGVWVFLRCGASERYDGVDVELARELGWRASLALDNAHLYALAQEAVRARDEVLGVVAHDLRNPLTTILLATRLAAGHPERAPAALDEIARAVGQMKRLVSDLLDRQAIASGRLTVRTGPVPAGELLRQALEDQRPAADAAAIGLEVADPGGLPAVLADVERVRQIFGNLVGNALKFTPAGGRVTLGARPGPGEVAFFVADTGPGFAPDALPHVFDRFRKERRADPGGTGLGLAICKGIVEAHGGRIWAENTPGAGATLWFTLPGAPEAIGGAPVPPAGRRSP